MQIDKMNINSTTKQVGATKTKSRMVESLRLLMKMGGDAVYTFQETRKKEERPITERAAEWGEAHLKRGKQ